MPSIEISDEDLKFLRELSHEIRTQDNAGTADPYFITVRTSRLVIVPQGHGSGDPVYHDEQDDEPATALHKSTEEAAKALADYGLTDNEVSRRVDALVEYGTEEVESDHNVFFTRVGYEAHMRLYGHNYGHRSTMNPHSYTHHASRNPEIKRLLEIVQKLGGQCE